MEGLYLLSLAATVCTLLLYTTGVPVIFEALKKRSIGEMALFPYYSFLFSACTWTKYALLKGDSTVSTVNGIGIVLQYANLVVFFICSTKKHRMGLMISLGASLLFSILVYCRFGLESADARIQFMGKVCICGSITAFGSPLSSLGEVFKSRSTESMNFSICLLNFLVASEWALYGYIKQDLYLMFPNGVGTILSVAQLIPFCFYISRHSSTAAATGLQTA